MTTTNTRGEYPPIAILERTRKALSKSVATMQDNDTIDGDTLDDMYRAYMGVYDQEREIIERRHLGYAVLLPEWVLLKLREDTLKRLLS